MFCLNNDNFSLILLGTTPSTTALGCWIRLVVSLNAQARDTRRGTNPSQALDTRRGTNPSQARDTRGERIRRKHGTREGNESVAESSPIKWGEFVRINENKIALFAFLSREIVTMSSDKQVISTRMSFFGSQETRKDYLTVHTRRQRVA